MNRIILLALGLVCLAQPAVADGLSPLTTITVTNPLPARATAFPLIEACFTTGNHSTVGSDCAAVAVNEIAHAKATLLVQAYNFTEPRIIAAIIAAHHRGVAVRVIVDKISASQKGEGVDPVHDAGIPVYVDRKPKIAHNKVMIIDGDTVITGSFNWSTNANCCNAENLLIVRSHALAAQYAENFHVRLAVSEPYKP